MKREYKVRQEKLVKLSSDKLNGLGISEYGRLVLCKYEEVEMVSNFVI